MEDMELRQYLILRYNSEDLNDLIKLGAGVLAIKERPTRKEERARLLARLLHDPENLRKIWEGMDEISRKALAAAYHNDGEFAEDAFVAQYGGLPKRPKKSQWSYASEPILLDLLLYQGHIPAELMPLLKEFIPPPDRFQLQGTDDLPAQFDDVAGKQIMLRVAETEQAGWHDLLLLLQLTEQQSLKFTAATNRLTPGSAAVLLGQLLQGDFLSPEDMIADRVTGVVPKKPAEKLQFDSTIRPFGLLTFSRGAGLINAHSDSLTALGRAFLTSQDPELLLQAFEKWTREGTFDEITRIDAIKGLRSHGLQLTAPAMRRERIVEALSWCPAGQWIAIDQFYRALKVWHFNFQIEEGGIEKLYIGYRYGSKDYYQPWADANSMWLLINGLYINAVLWEYLAAIGALDIAYLGPLEVSLDAAPYYDYDGSYYSRYDGLFYFRINPLGAYLFGQAGEYGVKRAITGPLLEIDAERLVTVLDAGRVTPMIKTQLEQFAVQEGEGRYRLDPPKLLQRLEQQADLEPLREFLVRNSAGSLPPAVEHWLDGIQRASSAFSIDMPMLRIRAASEELAQVVLTDAELSKFTQSLGNRTLVIPASRQTRFRARLRELGYGVRSK